jgi:hypothetical protein
MTQPIHPCEVLRSSSFDGATTLFAIRLRHLRFAIYEAFPLAMRRFIVAPRLDL